MKTQTQFKNASLVSVVNGSIVVKDSTGKDHTFTNASVVSVNNGTIIIEKEWMPKKGELIKMEGNCTDCYAIFKTTKEDSILHTYGHLFIGGYRIVCLAGRWHTKNVTISPVTLEEQKEFDDFCKSQGKLWNKETLQWEKYKWKPKEGEQYWYVASWGGVWCRHHINSDVDQGILQLSNVFQTKEQAEKALEQVKELFKSL